MNATNTAARELPIAPLVECLRNLVQELDLETQTRSWMDNNKACKKKKKKKKKNSKRH